MSSDTNIWETGVNDNGNGTDNNQYFISDTSDAEKRLTIQRGTGNIGVGTNEPSQLLDVSGNINLSGNIYLSNTGTIYKNGQEYAGGSEGTSTVWQENGTKIHYNAGNVGINTSDPTETLEVVGNIKATSLEGDGSGITNLDATELTGTIDNARLPANISVTNISGDGSGITNLDATELTGTIDNARLPANISVTNISGDGSGITNLDATELTGTLDNARLPANISITGDMTAKNLNITGVTTTINTDTYQTENLEIISTGADGPSLKITHDTVSHDVMQVIDANGTQSLTMTHEGKIGIGTDSPSAPLHIYDTSDVLKVSNSEITINRNILPETNDSIDIGSAERKIRDMYISDNSLWIGDDHKLAVSGDGTMKFRKRRKSTLPKVLRDASGNDQAALSHINSLHGTSYQNVTELKLNHVLSYARTINPEYKTSDIFGDDTEDYDQDTAADAWQINNSKIYLGSGYTNIGIGTNDPDPNFKLHVDGNVHTDGTISADDITIKGSAETGSGSIKLNCEANSHGVSIKGPPHSANQSYTLTLPSTAPEASKVLSTDGSGNLSWIDPGSSSASSIQNITTTASKVTIDTEMDVTNNVTIKGSGDTGSGSIKLNCEANSHGVSIKGPPHSANQSYTLTLPSTAPEASKVLSTDGSGNLSWIDQASGSGSSGSGSTGTSGPIELSVENIISPTTSPSLLSNEISSESEYKTIYFNYDSGNVNASGQTEYTLEFNNSTECDILLVGGGGGGGVDNSGGGGAGGLVLLENIQLYNGITIKVGGGGAGGPASQATAGLDGKDSAIEFSETYVAKGGGGGGTGNTSNGVHSGGNGGSGGGSAKETYTGTPGTSIQDQYILNGQIRGWGFAGGNGVDSAGGGGGGASEIGTDGDVAGDKLGGRGGDGKYKVNGTNFKTLFNITNTNIGDHIDGKVYFAGGGGGANDNNLNSTNLPDGSGYSNRGGFGGGGAGGYDTNNKSNPAIANTGGGGGGCTHFGLVDGGVGGSGIVILRYKYRKSLIIPANYYITKQEPQITSGPVNQVTNNFVSNNDLYKYMMFTYDATNDNGSGQTEYALNFLEDTTIDLLIVGGGGGGADSGGGGGGAGGVLLAESILLNHSTSYNIKVGKGGDGVGTNNGNNGVDSEFESIAVLGGGGGRGWQAQVGHNGGSGGGGGANNNSSPNTNGSSIQSKDKTTYGILYTLTNNGAGLNIYGENGGDGGINSSSSDLYDALGGGGGGATQVGFSGVSANGSNAGKGGDGINLSYLFGNSVGENGYFAGGGGAGSDGDMPTGLPGLGGGGQGYGQASIPNIDGRVNTGGGGGGAYRSSISGAGGSGVVIIRYLAKTLTQDIDTTLATKAGENIEWDTDNKQFTLTSNVTITSNLDVYNDINFMGNLYQNGELFVSGGGEVTNVTSNILVHKIIEPTTTPSINSVYGTPNDTEYKMMAFQYDSANDNGSEQSIYNITFDNDTICDIIIVGGGGGGGGGSVSGNDGAGGGGGAGGLVFFPNFTANGSYTIKVGNGGLGQTDAGLNGANSTIEKYDGTGTDGIENFIATGGGGGGDGATTDQYSGPGNAGGSGGGGGGNDATSGGISTQNTYSGKGFGNAGGNSSTSSGDQGGGGGGAGGAGQTSQSSSTADHGGEGGIGLHKVTIDGTEYKFKNIFGTSYGEYVVSGATTRDVGSAQDYFNLYYKSGTSTAESPIPPVEEGVYFAGGGAGKTGNNTNTNYLTYGGLGGGASVDCDTGVFGSGINGTGGGGTSGGKNEDNEGVGQDSGTNGGSGIVIIRYKIKKIFDDVTSLFQPQFYTSISEPSVANYGDVTTNLIAHYKFDGNLNNSIDNNIGTLVSTNTSAQFVDTSGNFVFGKSALVNNTTLTIPNFHFSDLIVGTSKSFTISFWFKANNIAGTWNILFDVSKYGSSNNGGIRFYIKSDVKQLVIVSYNGTSSDSIYISSLNGDFTDDKWRLYTIVFTYNSNTADLYSYDIKFYEDSVLNGIVNTKNIKSISTDGFQIGDGNPDATYYNEGYYDDFRIYDRTLLIDEIEKIYKYAFIDNKDVKNSDNTRYYSLKYDQVNNNGNNQTEYTLSFAEYSECEILLLDDNNYNYINYSNHNFYGNYTIKVGTSESSIEQSATNYVKSSNDGISYTLMYDFSSYTDLTAIQNYISTIPNANTNTTHYDDSYNGFYISGASNGYFMMTMPSGYDKIKVEYSNSYAGGTVNVYIGPADSLVNVSSVGASSSSGTYNKNTYEGPYIVGETVKIDEATGVIGNDLKITFIKNNYNSITGISTNYNTNNVIVKYKTKTLTQNIDTTLATKAGENIEWDTDNNKFTLSSNVAITSNLDVYNDINFMGNLYQNGELFVSGNSDEPIKLTVENIIAPTSSPAVLSYDISDESEYKTIYFTYDSGNVNASGQTEYTLNFSNSTECDILLVGGGGGGGSDNSGGGGAGGLVFLENITLNNGVTINVGAGGASAASGQSNTGQLGKDSTIIFGETYIAKGGGGGGTGQSSATRESGTSGGSGGGSAYEGHNGSPGTSTQDQYLLNGVRRGWGFAGGDGKVTSGSGQGAGGGGGGASEVGINGIVPGNKLGGHGGDGKYEVNGSDFKTIFNITDTTIGDHIDDKVYFAGGGGGGNDNDTNSTNLSDGSGYNNRGGFGGGGDGGYNSSNRSFPGIANTGGGGGGATFFSTNYKGGDGGSGIVILRYKYRKSLNIPSHYYVEKPGPQITSGPVAQVTDSYVTGSELYKYMMFTYDESESILIDFEPYTAKTDWINYADTLISNGLVSQYSFNHILEVQFPNSIFTANTVVGYIDFIVPSGYDAVDITYGSISSYTTYLKINDVDVDNTTTNSKIYTAQNIVGGQIIRIYETLGEINKIIKINYYKLQTEYALNFSEDTNADILIVAGGGAGGTYIGGGGGGGGVLHIKNTTINTGSYSIKVGKGGDSVVGQNQSALNNNGSSSKAFGIEVFGGGYGGGGQWVGSVQNGANGGSGGAGGPTYDAGNTNGGSILQPNFTYSTITVNNYNYYGGNGASGYDHSTGGVGANGGGGAGGDAVSTATSSSSDNAGAGADGIPINIDGNHYYWGGGGGGGQYNVGKGGDGGKGGGGGGNGSQQSEGVGIGGSGGITDGQNGDPEGDGTPTAGSGGANTGGGGGGTGRTTGSPNPVSGAGGSGVVIIRYLAKSLGQDIDNTLKNKAGENIEWDNTAKKYNLASDVTIANNLIVTGNIIQQYGMGTTESYLFLQTSAVFQNDDIDLYENRKTSITLQAWGPDNQWQSFGLSNKIAEQLQNCFTYFLKGNRRDGNIHIITLNNSQTNATADRKYYAMRISSTQMKVWGSYDTTYPLAYSSALTWVFSSGATIYKTF